MKMSYLEEIKFRQKLIKRHWTGSLQDEKLFKKALQLIEIRHVFQGYQGQQKSWEWVGQQASLFPHLIISIFENIEKRPGEFFSLSEPDFQQSWMILFKTLLLSKTDVSNWIELWVGRLGINRIDENRRHGLIQEIVQILVLNTPIEKTTLYLDALEKGLKPFGFLYDNVKFLSILNAMPQKLEKIEKISIEEFNTFKHSWNVYFKKYERQCLHCWISNVEEPMVNMSALGEHLFLVFANEHFKAACKKNPNPNLYLDQGSKMISLKEKLNYFPLYQKAFRTPSEEFERIDLNFMLSLSSNLNNFKKVRL